MKKRISLQDLLAALCAFFLSACTTDYSDAMIEEELEGTPSFILVNFRETAVEKGAPAYRVEGERAESYEDKKTTVIKNLIFTEYGQNAAVASEGSAGRATHYRDNDNILFEEMLRLNAVEQGFYIEGDYFYWDSGGRSLTGSSDGTVTLIRDDGSYITGTGFRSNASDRSFSFEKSAEGIYSEKDADEDM